MAVKALKLTRATLDNPVVYIRRMPDGALYVGETVSLRRRYNEDARKSIIHVRKGCQNTIARRRQEQTLIADLTALGHKLANTKVQTSDPAPIWTSCDKPDQPAKRKRWIPDPDTDPHDDDYDPD